MDPNPIIVTPMVPESVGRPCIAHGGCRKYRFLGTPQSVFGVALVVQPGVIEVSHDPQEAGALEADYAGSIGSIRDIYTRGRPPPPY